MVKVLIVEDDPMVAQINKNYVESIEEFKVVDIVFDGETALRKIQHTKIDLLILDVYMPKLDGLSLLKKLRNEGNMVDVIMVTAAQDTEKLKELLNLGAIDYLIKPFEYERFKDALERFLLKYELIQMKNKINQEDIDRITKINTSNVYNELPKGLNRRTLKRIRDFLKENSSKYYTAEEVSTAINLSRVTLRKYLEYMESIGQLKCKNDYGTRGRPSNKYKYI
ncbi:response regulator [Clostridium sediminicola]|uniref:response regulator n=1 Tax=Clostridium sediminicola TaxID=3114879 RepID=UPI0031F1EFAD